MKTTVIHELEDPEIEQLMLGKEITITEADGSKIVLKITRGILGRTATYEPLPDLKLDPAAAKKLVEDYARSERVEERPDSLPDAPEKPKRKYTKRAKATKIEKPKRAPKLAAVKNGFPCPDCNFVATTKSGLGGHKGKRHGKRGQPAARVIDKETIPVKRTVVPPRATSSRKDDQPRDIEVVRCDSCNHRDMAHDAEGVCQMPGCPCGHYRKAA